MGAGLAAAKTIPHAKYCVSENNIIYKICEII